MAEPRNYTEYLLLGEIERALDENNLAGLAPLARIAHGINLPLPSRVTLRLQIREALLTETTA